MNLQHLTQCIPVYKPNYMSTYLACDNSTGTVVMHEHPQYLGYDLGQVDFELRPQGPHDLLYQVDDGALHGTVQGPVIL